MGCALVLIGSATAGTPAVPAEADEAIVVQASPWASAAAEARVLADRILQRESDDLLLNDRRQRTLGHEIKQALSLIRRTYPAMASITARDAPRHGDASSRPGGRAARCRRRHVGWRERLRPAANRACGIRCPQCDTRAQGGSAVPYPRLGRPVSRRACEHRCGDPGVSRDRRCRFRGAGRGVGGWPRYRGGESAGALAFRLSPGVGRLPLRLHRRGALVLHRGGRRGRTDRARAGAQHGRLRRTRRAQCLALIRGRRGRPLRLRAGRSCRSGRSC